VCCPGLGMIQLYTETGYSHHHTQGRGPGTQPRRAGPRLAILGRSIMEMRPPWWPHGRDFLATRRVHPSQAQLATVWPRRSPSLPQASGQLRPSPRRQPALQLLRGDDHTTAGIRAPFRCLQGALASQLRSGIKHERPCTSGLQEASRAQIFYSLVPHPHCSGAAHDLEVSGDASFLLSRLVSPISVGR
jgi:hypothetical protein